MSFAPGDIVLVDLEITTSGHEQAGMRPAIFLYNEGGVSLIIPLTGNLARLRFTGTVQINPDRTNGLSKPSVALVFQMRAIDSQRLIQRIGTLSTKEKHLINKILRSVVLIK